MKLVIILLLIFNFSYSRILESKDLLFKSDSVKYYCEDDYVKAEIFFVNGGRDLVKVVWINPYENEKTTLLKCTDFDTWMLDTDIKK